MDENFLKLLKAPGGGELVPASDGRSEYLQSLSGERYPVRNGIICFLDSIPLTGNNKVYQRMYDRIAWAYDLSVRYLAFIKDGDEGERLLQYLSLLEIKEGDMVIEISSGTGRNFRYLDPEASYSGVDISFRMLKKCARNMKKWGREISLIQAEAENLPLKDGSFNVVFSAGGFNFFNDPGKAVGEMLRIAKPGTRILITDETETFRLKHTGNSFYNKVKIKEPVSYVPSACTDVKYAEICNGDLYALTFRKPA